LAGIELKKFSPYDTIEISTKGVNQGVENDH
jgi:hypothetical protein